MKWIDSHLHLCHVKLIGDIDALLERAYASGVETLVNIATTPEELEQGLVLSQRYPWIYQAGSTTPHDSAVRGEQDFAYFASHARAGRLIAIGETGLDYHYWQDSAEIQQKMLTRYLHLATECQLPVVVHCREAFSDLFRILDAHLPICGVIHCFTGTAQEAKELIARDWYLSFSGIVTFKKNHQLRETAHLVPIDRLLIETDAPYLAPVPYRGQRNEPAYLIEVAKCLADVYHMSLEAFASQIQTNTQRFFGF